MTTRFGWSLRLGALSGLALLAALTSPSNARAIANPDYRKVVTVTFPSHSSGGGSVVVTVNAADAGGGLLTNPITGNDPTGLGFTGEFVQLTSGSSSLTFAQGSGVTVNGQFSTTYSGGSGVTVTAESCNRPHPLQTYCAWGSAPTP